MRNLLIKWWRISWDLIDLKSLQSTRLPLPFFALDDRLDKLRKKKKQMALNYIFIEQLELALKIYNDLKNPICIKTFWRTIKKRSYENWTFSYKRC